MDRHNIPNEDLVALHQELGRILQQVRCLLPPAWAVRCMDLRESLDAELTSRQQSILEDPHWRRRLFEALDEG
jgi:hypothetical protein